jgi:hypothetical protein
VAEVKPDWISVRVRLPDDRRLVLVTQGRHICGVKLKPQVNLGHITTGEKWSCDFSFFVGFAHVTHWAELPEAAV